MAGKGVELLFGPMLIGVFLNTILYGIMVMQSYVYYQTYKKDAPWIRYFVLYLFIVETLNTGFDIGMMYEPLIVRYATPRATIIAPIMLSADPLLTVMISGPVQAFIAWRVRVISKSYFIPAVIVFLAIASFAGGVAATVCVSIINDYASFHKFDGAIITWLAGSAGADVLITASLVLALSRQKTGYSHTDDIINRIVRLTVQTGLITALSAIADVTLFLTLKGTTINYIWDFALSKLYTNSLLSTLNARQGFFSNAAARMGSAQQEQTNFMWHDSSDLANGKGGTRAPTNLELPNLPSSGSKRSSNISMMNKEDYGLNIGVTKVVERTFDPPTVISECEAV